MAPRRSYDRVVERYRQLEQQQCWTKRASMSGQQGGRAGSDERLGFTAALGTA